MKQRLKTSNQITVCLSNIKKENIKCSLFYIKNYKDALQEKLTLSFICHLY